MCVHCKVRLAKDSHLVSGPKEKILSCNGAYKIIGFVISQFKIPIQSDSSLNMKTIQRILETLDEFVPVT